MRVPRKAVSLVVVGVVAAAAACGESKYCSDDMALDLSEFTIDAYNQALINHGSGSVDVMWTCPQGGTAHITGTIISNNVDTNLTFVFAACKDNVLSSTLTLTGTMTDITMNGGSATGRTETGHSAALTMYGHNDVCHADPIDVTCPIDFTLSGGGNDTSNICGIKNP